MERPESDASLQELVREHAALRRLATLVAREPSPAEVFEAVAREVGTLLVSEAITNAAKHAQADTVVVEVKANADTVLVSVADDGVGGADTARGSGLGGLADRVEAVGGRLEMASPEREGTRISARLPTRVLGSLNGFSGGNS